MMKLDISFPALVSLVQRMRARPVSWESGQNILIGPDIREILLKGIEINIDEVEVTSDNLLTYQGEQILLYIQDTGKDKDTLLHDTEHAPRFHLADCRTLDIMRKKNRFARYVATQNTSGVFKAHYHDRNRGERGEVESELKVCRNCLILLNYKGYRDLRQDEKADFHNHFDIEEFFKKYQSKFRNKPSHTDETAPQSGYTDNWDEISKNFRAAKGWKCRECGVDLSLQSNHRLLHVHHMNGVKSDNRPHNLKCLCLLCHKQEPSHSHMHVPVDDKAIILKLRREQSHQQPSGGAQSAQSHQQPTGGARDHQQPSGAVPGAHPTNNLHTHTTPPPTTRQNVQRISREQARQELISLRSKLNNIYPDIEPSKGLLRKVMLNHFLEKHITSEAEFKNKVPAHDRNKTAPRQLMHLKEVFEIIQCLQD